MKKILKLSWLILFGLPACAADPVDAVSSKATQKRGSEACQTDNDSLRAMPRISVELTRSDGSVHSITAKLANTNATRAAGFQRVCAFGNLSDRFSSPWKSIQVFLTSTN